MLFDAPVLVVNQKAKVFEMVAEYVVRDESGNQLGAVREVGQSKARKVLRFVSQVDDFLTHRYEIVDSSTGSVVLRVTRPRRFLKANVVISGPDDAEIGRVVQQNVIGKIRFALVAADGTAVGSINAENWRAWDFSVCDASGAEVARVTKKWAGLGRELFTTADNYVVSVPSPLAEPLRSIVVASALCIDTALKQDSGGGLR
jgi:uncharacterized protein YxjI